MLMKIAADKSTLKSEFPTWRFPGCPDARRGSIDRSYFLMLIFVEAGDVEEIGSVEEVAGICGVCVANVAGHPPWTGLVSYVREECCQEDSIQSSVLHHHSSIRNEESSRYSPHDEAFQFASLSSTTHTQKTACVEGARTLRNSVSCASAPEALVRIVGRMSFLSLPLSLSVSFLGACSFLAFALAFVSFACSFALLSLSVKNPTRATAAPPRETVISTSPTPRRPQLQSPDEAARTPETTMGAHVPRGLHGAAHVKAGYPRARRRGVLVDADACPLGTWAMHAGGTSRTMARPRMGCA